MTTAFKLSLPVDIPWERICVSEDMLDREPCDLKFPPKWQSSIAVYKFVPADEYQNYPRRKITYLKVTATITGYQPRDEEIQGNLDWNDLDVTTRTGVTELLDSYYPCHGAIIQILVGPKNGGSEVPLKDYPYIHDFEPKKRELFEMATDTHERSSRSLETLNISNSAGTTRSLEVMDIDMGGSTSFGLSGSYAGTGGGFNFGTSNAGQWGTKSVNTDASQATRTTDVSQEKRETFSHTTQLSQMYHLLDSYHLGTNRAVFFVQPRPHVLEEPSGFVRGPRPVEGIQEFFLVISQPEDAADFCVSARMDTSHLVTTDILDYTYRTDISNLASAVAEIPTRNDEYIGTTTREACFIDCWDITYKCYRSRDVSDRIYTAPAGFTIQGYNNLVNESRHGSTSVTIAPGNKTLTVHAEAIGHICFEHSGVCVDCPDEIEKYSGYARRQVQVNLRSEERDRKIGEEEVLLLTTRGLCCCPTDGPILRAPKVTGVFSIPDVYGAKHVVESAVVRPLHDDYAGSFHASGERVASVKEDLTAMRATLSAEAHAEAKPADCGCGGGDAAPAPGDLSPRMTIRQANGMVGFIRNRMLKAIESEDPANAPKAFYQTDLFARRLRTLTMRTRRSRETAGRPAIEVLKDKGLVDAIAKDLEIKAKDVTLRDVLSYRNEHLAQISGRKLDDIVTAKLAAMGLRLTEERKDDTAQGQRPARRRSRPRRR